MRSATSDGGGIGKAWWFIVVVVALTKGWCHYWRGFREVWGVVVVPLCLCLFPLLFFCLFDRYRHNVKFLWNRKLMR